MKKQNPPSWREGWCITSISKSPIHRILVMDGLQH
jgi:hypothetical protein